MAHASLKEHTENVASIRLVSRELNQPIAILIDLAWPKIRLGELPGGQIDCHRGDELRFVRGSEATLPGDVTTTYEPLVDELELGKLVMLADGAVSVRVEDKGKDFACCRVVQPGLIRSRQGLNLPGMKLSAPSMDEGDREHALWAAEMGIDFIGLSFVRRPEDVRELKELLRSKNSSARVIAKIEKTRGARPVGGDHRRGLWRDGRAGRSGGRNRRGPHAGGAKAESSPPASGGKNRW